MIEIIAGEKGKGKTKELLAKVNHSVAAASGNIVYLDKSQKHMYELNNKVRLINVMDYPIDNCDEFLGFLCGIVSQDHDLEEMYLIVSLQLHLPRRMTRSSMQLKNSTSSVRNTM